MPGMKNLWLTVFLISACLLVQGQANNRRDGNWWLEQQPQAKYSYVSGFVDGMFLGRDIGIWNFMDDKGKKECVQSVEDSHKYFWEKYFDNLTNGQIADGLDDFYKDYRNRKIEVHGAIWLVVNAIAGTPKDELEKMTESWRRNAH